MRGKCCLAGIVQDTVKTIAEEIANLNLTTSFPAVADILLGATADYLNTISGGLKEYAGGAFSYLLADIMDGLEKKLPDKIFETIGNTGNGLLAIVDVMLNANTEILLAAAYYSAVELNKRLNKYIDLIREIEDIVFKIRDELVLIDAPVQYKELVKQDINSAIGDLLMIDRDIDNIIKSTGPIRSTDIEILRDKIELLCHSLCNHPLEGPKFPGLKDLFKGNWGEIWENFKDKFTTCYKLLQELTKKLAELYIVALEIDFWVNVILKIDIDKNKATPYYTTYKKTMLIKIKEMKQALERQMIDADPTASLYKWPEWCGEALMLKSLFQIAFPEDDKLLETVERASAKAKQIKEAQEKLRKTPSLAITTFRARIISLQYYAGFTMSYGANDIQRGFINNIVHKTQQEGDKLIDAAYRVKAAIEPILVPPYESPLFVAIVTILEALNAKAAIEWLYQGDVAKLRDGIARWAATGGLALTAWGELMDCLTPLLNNSKLSLSELQTITQWMQDAMRNARSLKINIPLPSLNLPLNLDPSSYLKYKNKLQEKMNILNSAMGLLDRISQKVASELYSCD